MSLRSILRNFKDSAILAPILLPIYRICIVCAYLLSRFRLAALWLIASKETTNFTYEISQRNTEYLAAIVADALATPNSQVLSLFAELQSNSEIQALYTQLSSQLPYRLYTDPKPLFGRRLAWYAIVRIKKPKIVVETGVDKGLGALVLTAALLKNAEEGSPGRYYGTDINPNAGFFLQNTFSTTGEILVGDSLMSLAAFDQRIGVFINDSDHSSDYEAAEYENIHAKLTDDAIVIGDNCGVTDKLYRYSEKYSRTFLYLQEEPINHWHHGGGLGLSFRRT